MSGLDIFLRRFLIGLVLVTIGAALYGIVLWL